MKNLDIQKSLAKFNELPKEIILSVDNSQIADKMHTLEKKHQVDLSPLIIYITVGDIMMVEASEFLQTEYGLDPDKAQAAVKDLEKKIIDPIVRRLNFFDSMPEKDTITLDEEKEILNTMFSTGLMVELDENPIIINAINMRIFNALKEDLKFKKVLENAMYTNQENVTKQKIVIDKKSKDPTIANWLKDFIKRKGSGIFDNLVLTEYIANSENTRKLSEKDMTQVKKILVLYRNLKFFPESMSSDDGEGWEILPVEEGSLDILLEKPTLGIPKTKEEKQIDQLKKEEKKYRAGGLEQLALEEEVDKKKQIEELEIMAKKYKNNSLEKKALLEEIEKIKKR